MPFTNQDRKFMELAIEQAALDPRIFKVGAVIARGENEIVRAHGGEIGKQHAELTAIQKCLAKKLDLIGATLYTTLEPCTPDARHPGREPCANEILKHPFKRVVIGVLDPNHSVRMKGVAILQGPKLEVVLCDDPDLRVSISRISKDFFEKEWPRLRSMTGFSLDVNFHGRSNKRRELTEWLTRRGPHGAKPILQLWGIGGIGKSNLSWLWAKHDVAEEEVPVDTAQLTRLDDQAQQTEGWLKPLRIIWFSFYEHEGGRGNDYRSFLEEALTHLSAGTFSPEDFSEQKTRNYGAIQRAVLDTLQTQRSLIVWDGAERLLNEYASGGDAALQVERPLEMVQDRPDALRCRDLAVSQFLWAVTAQTTSKLLIASRLPFADLDDKAAASLELRGLDPEAALRVLQKRGVTGPEALLEAAASEYEFHPLSLSNLAASLHADFERKGDISGRRPLDPAMPRDKRRQHVFGLAFERRDASWRHLLSRLSHVRGRITRDVIKLLAKDVPGLAPSELGTSLAELCRHGLLRKHTDGDAYDFHPVIRKYIYDREDYADERQDVHRRLAEYYQPRALEVNLSSVNDVRQLAPWFEYFYHTARSGELREAFQIFNERSTPTLNSLLYFYLGEHLIFIDLLEELLPKEDDSANTLSLHELAIVANNLGLAYSHVGETDTAIRLLKTAVTYQIDLEKDAAEELEKDAAEKLRHEEIFNALWNLWAAKRNKRTAQKEIGRAHEGLATCYLQAGLLEETNTVLFKAKTYYKGSGYEFGLRAVLPRYFGELYGYLGQTKKARGMFRSGITYLRKRVGPAEKPNMDYVRGMCIDHIAFAKMELYLSHFGNARKYVDEAVRYLSILGTEQRAHELEIQVEWLVNYLKVSEDNFESAETGLLEVLAKCRTLRLVHLEVQVLLSLVVLAVKLAAARAGTTDALPTKMEGISVGKNALRIAERCKYRRLEAEICYWLAQSYIAANDPARALEYAQRAYKCASCDSPAPGKFQYVLTCRLAKMLVATLERQVAGI